MGQRLKHIFWNEKHIWSEFVVKGPKSGVPQNKGGLGSKWFLELKPSNWDESIHTKYVCVTIGAKIFHFKNVSSQATAGTGVLGSAS